MKIMMEMVMRSIQESRSVSENMMRVISENISKEMGKCGGEDRRNMAKEIENVRKD